MEEPRVTSNLNAGEEKQYYRWGGIAALLLAAGYVAIIPLFAWVGAPPATGEAWFRYLPGKTTAWWVIICRSRSGCDLDAPRFSAGAFPKLLERN